ncbi:MAG: hypothetical protein ACK6DP_03770 [Gemmatimonas sp.]|uniref:hypothetical protein n=1 Tax=Gemmatimonas sp. TaxID=1962908 RepID=UPI00391F858A
MAAASVTQHYESHRRLKAERQEKAAFSSATSANQAQALKFSIGKLPPGTECERTEHIRSVPSCTLLPSGSDEKRSRFDNGHQDEYQEHRIGH